MFLIPIIIITIHFIFTNSDKIITYSFNLRQSLPVMEIDFINENSQLSNFINTYLPYSVYNLKYFEKIFRNKISNPSVLQLIDYHKVYEYYADLSFITYYLTDFKFIISTNHSEFIADQGISLAYKFKNESFSFIHHLYKNNLIDHKKFTISYRTGEIHFGGVNEYIPLKYKGSCNVNEGYYSWGCNMKGIRYNNKYYPFNTYAAFHSAYNDMFLMDEFYNFMIQEVLKKEIDEKICYEELSVYGNYVYCDNLPNENKPISFDFEGFSVRFYITDLFKQLIKGQYKSIFGSLPIKFYQNKLILGVQFFKHFHYINFDYENKKIELYSEKTPIYFEKDIETKYNFFQIFVLSIITVCLIGITLLIVTWKILFI